MTPRIPPGPPRISWLGGHLGGFRTGRLDFFVQMARNYGDMVKVRFGKPDFRFGVSEAKVFER